MSCWKCKFTDDYELGNITDEEMKSQCNHCRKILKYELVKAVRELEPVYLSEQNRNKKGRKKVLSLDEKYEVQGMQKIGMSMSEIAKKMNVSKSTIFNTIHEK